MSAHVVERSQGHLLLLGIYEIWRPWDALWQRVTASRGREVELEVLSV